MTVAIRSRLKGSRLKRSVSTWFVTSEAVDADAPIQDRYLGSRFGFATTLADALELAAEQRADLDQELSDAAHASQASRREARAAQLSAETQQMIDAAAALPSALVTLPKPPPFPMIPIAHLFKKEATE